MGPGALRGDTVRRRGRRAAPPLGSAGTRREGRGAGRTRPAEAGPRRASLAAGPGAGPAEAAKDWRERMTMAKGIRGDVLLGQPAAREGAAGRARGVCWRGGMRPSRRLPLPLSPCRGPYARLPAGQQRAHGPLSAAERAQWQQRGGPGAKCRVFIAGTHQLGPGVGIHGGEVSLSPEYRTASCAQQQEPSLANGYPN